MVLGVWKDAQLSGIKPARTANFQRHVSFPRNLILITRARS